MALYHLSVNNISRSQGKSAVGSFLYQSRGKGKTEDGIIRNYTGKKYGKCLSIFFVHSAESEPYIQQHKLISKQNLWREVEQQENRVNSRFCKDFNIALQAEFSLKENMECLQTWIESNFTSKNLVSSVCIHDGHDGNNNRHAHVMVTMRGLTQNGWSKNKDRDIDKKEYLVKVRESWASICNDMFEKKGLAARIDSRTLEEQGIERKPQRHNGPKKSAMLRRIKIDKEKLKAIENRINNIDDELWAIALSKPNNKPQRKSQHRPRIDWEMSD